MTDAPAARPSALAPFAWGAFLASSWTWCIGMFLPVILVRDYGVWAWVVFAVPNVVGAAAMGWVLRPGQSEAMVAAHRPALVAFSVVTAAFQVFFTLWMLPRLGLSATHWGTLSCFLVLVVALARQRPQLALSAAALVASAVVWTLSAHTGELVPPQRLWATDADRFPADLARLAPVILFGFAFCPYLDLTFHRARQQTTWPQARAAFTLGFGVLFAAMIVFTLYYAVPLSRHLIDPTQIGPALLKLIALHMLVQLAFTIGVHWRHSSAGARPGVLVAFASAALGVLAWLASTRLTYRGFGGGELVYLLFMAFYGLVFPAYAWLCMTPTWRAPASPDRRTWTVYAVVVALATPMYRAGFVDRQTTWLLPALAVVLLARVLTRARRNDTSV